MSKLIPRKLQEPTSKLQRSSKLQASIRRPDRSVWSLVLGVSLVLGAWCLVLSFLPDVAHAFAEPARGHDFLLRVKVHAFFSLDVQVAVEGFVPAGEGKHRHGRGDADVNV